MSNDEIEQINKDSYNISKVDSFFSLDDLEFLPNRWLKGYTFEMKLLSALIRNGMIFTDYNPTSFQDWIKHNNDHVGYDLEVKIGDQLVPVEVKYISKPIYDSWLKRDWLTRSAPIIVCNNKWLLTYQQRRMLKAACKKLFSLHEFIWYLYRKNRTPSSFILTLTSNYLNKGCLAGCFLAGVLAGGARKLEIYFKLNRLRSSIIKIGYLIAHSIFQAAKNVVLSTCSSIRRCLGKLKSLYSLNFKHENLEISFLIEEESIFKAIDRGKRTAANMGWILTGVFEVFKNRDEKPKQKKEKRKR